MRVRGPKAAGRRRFYWANFSPNLVNTSHVDLASFRFLPHTNNA